MIESQLQKAPLKTTRERKFESLRQVEGTAGPVIGPKRHAARHKTRVEPRE